MDISILFAVIGSAFTSLAATIGLFLWVRAEANADRRHFLTVQESDRKDILQLIRSMENEMKDFHYRLLEIEKNRK